MGPNAEGSPMNGIFLCTAIALNIFSMPAGNTVVGQVPYGKAVQIQDTSLMRDWVFIGKPGDVPKPPWLGSLGLRYCPNVPNAPEPEGGS